MSPEDREIFVDNIFDALASTEAKTLTDLNTDRKKIRKAWNSLDTDTKNAMFNYIKLLFKERTKNIAPRKEKLPAEPKN